MPYKNTEEQKEFQSTWYQKNKDKCRQKLKDRRKQKAILIMKLKEGKTCRYCLESHPACLEFHHINPDEKHKDISIMLNSAFSDKAILEEVAKCELVCSNCHRKIHYKNWTRTVS